MPFNASPCNIFMLRLLIAVCALFQCAQGEDQLTRLYSERNPKHADIVTVNIRKAVIEYVLDEEYAVKRYGPIESWDTSEVTDMSYLFFHGRCSENSLIDICIKRLKNFDEDISAWDVSSVSDMSKGKIQTCVKEFMAMFNLKIKCALMFLIGSGN
uniref:Uncharacterized protein n=1 Tax=Proboscia inermis TaxID=420281 RepID=A0A7S0C716_9STRA|mmetsp:Transcript_31114/g.31394  ORF Transcript_31114/g.31394 Transcript_31114/m.31394 type:complete len:156 (+) Transcript_31114:37-504(+)